MNLLNPSHRPVIGAVRADDVQRVQAQVRFDGAQRAHRAADAHEQDAFQVLSPPPPPARSDSATGSVSRLARSIFPPPSSLISVSALSSVVLARRDAHDALDGAASQRRERDARHDPRPTSRRRRPARAWRRRTSRARRPGGSRRSARAIARARARRAPSVSILDWPGPRNAHASLTRATCAVSHKSALAAVLLRGVRASRARSVAREVARAATRDARGGAERDADAPSGTPTRVMV